MASRRVSRSTTREDLGAPPGEQPACAHASTERASASAADVSALVEAGAIEELLGLALDQRNKQAVREGGGILPIVRLLPGEPVDAELPPGETGGTQHQAVTVVSALWSLAAQSAANQDAIREAGGVPLLVRQLSRPGTSADAPDLAGHVAGALWSLASNNTSNQHAVREAGGVGALIALLESAASASPDGARHAVRAPAPPFTPLP